MSPSRHDLIRRFTLAATLAATAGCSMFVDCTIDAGTSCASKTTTTLVRGTFRDLMLRDDVTSAPIAVDTAAMDDPAIVRAELADGGVRVYALDAGRTYLRYRAQQLWGSDTDAIPVVSQTPSAFVLNPSQCRGGVVGLPLRIPFVFTLDGGAQESGAGWYPVIVLAGAATVDEAASTDTFVRLNVTASPVTIDSALKSASPGPAPLTFELFPTSAIDTAVLQLTSRPSESEKQFAVFAASKNGITTADGGVVTLTCAAPRVRVSNASKCVLLDALGHEASELIATDGTFEARRESLSSSANCTFMLTLLDFPLLAPVTAEVNVTGSTTSSGSRHHASIQHHHHH